MVRGKYRIDSFIASGSMSNVYAATHRNGSRVALKILHKDLARDTSLAERFRREGYLGNAVVHPGIVKAIDDDMTDDGCAFLVFDLLEGQTLEEKRARAGGKLQLAEVLNVGDAILDILQAAHDHQILHRDLKPDNVYITRKGDIKLFDFGSARFNDGKSTSELTATGVVLGTPAFMPPEQATGKRNEVDARADLWGVGAMLFACLTGQGVHVGGDLKTKSIAVARSKARSLRDVAPEIPRVVAAVIDRSLSFDKAERYADAKSMREALGWARRSLTGEEVDSPAMSEDPATKRHRAVSERPIDRDSEEMPTMAAVRVPSLTNEAEPDFEDEGEDPDEATEKRTRIGARAVALLSRAPEIKRGLHAPSEGVVTSAPPVTLREKHAPSMPPSEGPTFSLRQDPVFSLRDQKGRDDERNKETLGALEQHKPPPAAGRPIESADQLTQAAPRTERLPRAGSDPETPKLPPGGMNAGLHADPGALFRAALEKGMQETNDSINTQAPVSPRVIVESTPLPAPMPRAPVPLIMPGQDNVSPLGATVGVPLGQPGMHATTPGGYGAPVPAPGINYNHTPNPMSFGAPQLGGTTAPMPGYNMTGPPPPAEDPIARAQFRNESVSTRPPPGSDQFSSVRPGPLLSSVTSKPKGGGWRILVPILIGIAAGVGTYVVIMRQKAARAHQVAPAPAPAPTVSALPSALTAPSVLPLPSASVAPSASVSAAPSASAAPTASVKKKPKPKPKPPPPDQGPAAEPAPAPPPELL